MEKREIVEDLKYKVPNSHEYIDFFILFSRFEYAMKKANIVHGANASWETLFTKIGTDQFLVELKNAQSHNIRIGMGNNGELAKVDHLYQFMNVLRNNLFHGSKGDSEDDHNRNKQLTELGINILIKALLLSKQSREGDLKVFCEKFYP